MEDILPGKTRWETEQYRKDHGKRAAQAEAILRLGLILETDEDSPPPLLMTHDALSGGDTFWGQAALPTAGDKAGTAAVDAWAARHHATAGWENGKYRAVMHLGGGYRYGVVYMPASVVYPQVDAVPELAVAI